MGISKDVPHILFILLFLMSILIGGVLIKLFLLPLPDLPSVWEGYRVYAFVSSGGGDRKGLTEGESAKIEKIFDTHGYDTHGYVEVIHRKEQKVHVFTYGGMERKALSELESIYDPRDPLYDPYMQGLPEYYSGSFNGREAELFYVAERAETVTETFALHRDLDKAGLRYTSSGAIPGARIFTFVLFLCIFLLFLFVLRKEGLILYFLGSIHLFPGLLSGSFLYLSQTVLLLTGWAAVLALGKKALSEYMDIKSEKSRKECIRAVAVYAVCSGASLLLALLSRSHGGVTLLLQQLSSILIQTSLAAVYTVYRKYSAGKREHIPFYPESIKLDGSGRHMALRRAAAVVFGCMWAAPFLYTHIAPSADLVIPTPVQQSGEEPTGGKSTDGEEPTEGVPEHIRGFSWASLERFAEAKKRESTRQSGESKKSDYLGSSIDAGASSTLPDITDYLSHRAYQEGFFFGRPYGFPSPGEEIRLNDYSFVENSVIPKERVVKMFTDDWYEDIIVEAYSGGVTRLLLSQDGPVKVLKQKVRLLPITEDTLLSHMGIYAVVFLFFVFIRNRKRTQKFISKENIVMRKGRKVA
ncbi:MAG: hypothetical protein ACLFMZ_03805 [Spirochaetaceae bacterium]